MSEPEVSPAVPEVEEAASTGNSQRKRKKRRHRSRKRGLPAHLVFYLIGALSVVSIGLMFLPELYWLAAGGGACLLIAWVLFLNDHTGFVRSKQMRRAHEPRRHFTMAEQAILLGLLVLNVVVACYLLITRWSSVPS